jgi:hypothetical protein
MNVENSLGPVAAERSGDQVGIGLEIGERLMDGHGWVPS